MKTVKEYLCELDTSRLVDEYFCEYGEKLYDLYYYNTPTGYDDRHIDYDESVRDLSVYDYAQATRKEIYDFIKYLKSVDITECSRWKTGIIYAFRKYDEDYFMRMFHIRLLFWEELLSDPENCKNHDFEYVKFSEVLGFRVADNQFTQSIIHRVIASIMHILSATGYRQENLEHFYESYKKQNGTDFEPYAPIDERSLHFIRYDQNMIMRNETTESRDRLFKVRKDIYEYELYLMKRERSILLESIKKG